LLRRAKDALDRLEQTLAQYPEARAELEGHLGPGRLAALQRATTDVRDAFAALPTGLERE